MEESYQKRTSLKKITTAIPFSLSLSFFLSFFLFTPLFFLSESEEEEEDDSVHVTKVVGPKDLCVI